MPGFINGPVNGIMDRLKGRGYAPASFMQGFGKGAAMCAGGGNITVNTSAAGAGNGADTTEDTLFTVTLPPNSLDIVNREVWIQRSEEHTSELQSH